MYVLVCQLETFPGVFFGGGEVIIFLTSIGFFHGKMELVIITLIPWQEIQIQSLDEEVSESMQQPKKDPVSGPVDGVM